MASSIPEYYRHLAEQRRLDTPDANVPPEAAAGRAIPRPGPRPPVVAPTRAERQPPAPPMIPYRAQHFHLSLYEGWRDKTIYFLTGPVADGIQHNVVVTLDDAMEAMSLVDFADTQVRAIEDSLQACRILLKGPIALQNGMPAYRVLYSWQPKPEIRYYQEQIYLLHENIAYKLTATFTKKTRKTLGPQVERIMLSFEPVPPPRP